ncbi:MAG: DNA repair protein RecO, partial [Bacteroidales bacterium]|nr:DNA repair protein RecO [Bacteroidales bacterium]
MIQTTEAVILKSFPYSDSSLIVKAYTKDFGLQSYILRSARSNKGKTTKAQHFQPLRLVQLELSSNPKARLHSIKSSALMLCCDDTSCNIVKTTLAIFMTEVLNLSIRENTASDELFDFLKSRIIALERADCGALAEFHLHFLLDLSSILGFEPLDN